MIRPRDRKIATLLVRLGAFRPERTFFSCWAIRPVRGFWWAFNLMRRRQTSDGLKHAPCCPGNEWSGAELVFRGCNCGAVRYALEDKTLPELVAWGRNYGVR